MPKFVYICALLPTPNELLKQLNQLLYSNSYGNWHRQSKAGVGNKWMWKGGLKMIDLETMVKSLILAWLKRIFN